MKYLIQYWLPKQSRLYSEPQQVEADGEGALQNALATAKKPVRDLRLPGLCDQTAGHQVR